MLLKTTLLKYLLLFIFTGYNQADQKAPVVIEGKVVAEATGQPVTDAHVYVLDGEEEALTNQKGEFRIQSWQNAPFKLTVERADRYHKITIVITDPSRKQVIRLRNK
jgi:hypothetical protein